MVEKVVRGGKVAVLVSPEFGAGWSTWESSAPLVEFMKFDKSLVDLVEQKGSSDKAEEIIQSAGFEPPYMGGWRDLKVWWVPQGTAFQITEYDGAESLEASEEIAWCIA